MIVGCTPFRLSSGYESPKDMAGTKIKDIYVDQGDRKRLVKILEKEGGLERLYVLLYKKKNERKFTLNVLLT
jgi:hypothetical protein